MRPPERYEQHAKNVFTKRPDGNKPYPLHGAHARNSPPFLSVFFTSNFSLRRFPRIFALQERPTDFSLCLSAGHRQRETSHSPACKTPFPNAETPLFVAQEAVTCRSRDHHQPLERPSPTRQTAVSCKPDSRLTPSRTAAFRPTWRPPREGQANFYLISRSSCLPMTSYPRSLGWSPSMKSCMLTVPSGRVS